MEEHIQSVIDTLGYVNTGSLPRGELFISRDFLDYFFAEHRENYPRQLAAAARSMGLSLVGIDLNNEESRPPLPRDGLKELGPFFAVGYINGPVERLIETHGFVTAMVSLRKRQPLFAQMAATVLKELEDTAKATRRDGLMALTIADDIAGNRGLLFSPDYFADVVCPVYRDMARIIKGNGLSAFFHSDGDMRKVIEFLIEAGYECIHPVDGQGGLDVYDLRSQFAGKVTFMGHMDIMTWDAGRIRTEVTRAEQAFAGGGLILGSMSGISMKVRRDSLAALYGGLSSPERDGMDG